MFKSKKHLVNEYIKIEKIFFVIAIVFGITFSIINAPFQDPDENAHFYRAYQLSTGQILEERVNQKVGGFLPKSILNTYNEVTAGVTFHSNVSQDFNKVKKFIKIKLDKKNVVFEDFNTAAMYSPIVYIPQVIGIEIGKIFGLSPLMLMYLGRIANLICWASVVYIAIKILPFKKIGMVFLALAPMSIYQAASLSSDGMTNALAFLSIAMILQYAFDEKLEIDKKHIVRLFIVIIALSLCKQVYFAFALLFLLIPKEKFKSNRAYYLTFITMIFSCMLFLGIWSEITSSLTEFAHGSVSPQNQVKFVLMHPLYYIKTILNTFYINRNFYFCSYIGEFGWLDTYAPIRVYFIFPIVFVLILLFDNGIKLRIRERLIFLITFIGLIGLVMTALYVIWTPLGSNNILGVQGRYFIPIAPLILYICNWKNRYSAKRTKLLTFVVLFASTINLILCVIRLGSRFYGLQL